jgi:hypothetical protein
MIRVGLVGFGMVGRVFHAPLISSVEGLELAAVMERTSDKAAERYPGIVTYRSLDAMLADDSLGLFVVATPSQSHFEVASQILKAGKNLIVDKPVCTTSAEIAQLMELAAAHNAFLPHFITAAGTVTSRRFRNCCVKVRWAVWSTLSLVLTAGGLIPPPTASGRKTPPREAFCSTWERIWPTRRWCSSASRKRSPPRFYASANGLAPATLSPSACAIRASWLSWAPTA